MSQLFRDKGQFVVRRARKVMTCGIALLFSRKLAPVIVFGAATLAFSSSNGQTRIDPNPAANNPDKFAWDLFIELNRPALAGRRGIPDPDKTHGDPGLRVWETWKITTQNGQEVFLNGGARPKPWEEGLQQMLNRTTGKPVKFLSPPKFTFVRNPGIFATFMAKAHQRIDKNNGQESRINRPGFDFIVKNCLYSIDGQEEFRKTDKGVDFPIDTIAVKTAWRKFSETEKTANIPPRYSG